MKQMTLMAAFVATVALGGCAVVKTSTASVQEPSASTMQALQTAVTLADTAGFAYENLASTSNAERAKTEEVVSAMNAAWASFQAGVKANQPVSISGMEAAISAVEATESPAVVVHDNAVKGQ
jgi:uncharacterized protein YceK